MQHGAEGAERRRWGGKGPGRTRTSTSPPEKRLGARMPTWGMEGVVGARFFPTSSCATDHQARCPKNASHPFPQPYQGLHPPQESERWRKMEKPTKIFPIRQICGADKSRTGWDEVSFVPQWGGPIKCLVAAENASSPASSGAHCPSHQHQELTQGVLQ